MKHRILILIAVIILSILLIPSPVSASATLDEAVERVRIEAEYFNNTFPEAPPEFAYALSAMNYVKFHISPYRYDYFKKQGQDINTIEDALKYEAGLCGMHTMVFQAIMDELEIRNRYVQCFNIDGKGYSHIFAEVTYDGDWNVFDITAGAFFVDGDNTWNTMSFKEVRNCENYLNYLVADNAGVYNRLYLQAGYDVFEYITSDTVEIVYEGEAQPPPPPVAPVAGGGFIPVPGYTNIVSKQTTAGYFIVDTYCFSEDKRACLYIPEKTTGKKADGGFISTVGIFNRNAGYIIDPPKMVFSDYVTLTVNDDVYHVTTTTDYYPAEKPFSFIMAVLMEYEACLLKDGEK